MSTRLNEKLQELFGYMSGGSDKPPSPTSVLIAELTPESFERGRPRIHQESLRSPSEYAARFDQLMAMGFGWLNMNYCGVLHGHALVLIEYPREPARAKGATSVNYSGPPKLVADAGWDALAYVTVL